MKFQQRPRGWSRMVENNYSKMADGRHFEKKQYIAISQWTRSPANAERPRDAVSTHRSPHFCFPWKRLCNNHAICCTDGNTIHCLPNLSQHVPIYLQQFPSYSNRKCKKIAFFTYRSPHFCFTWRCPCDYHAICCMDGKTIQCSPNPRSMYLSIFNSFRVIRCLS